ncbi:MAG: hypothetical protein LBD55_05815 [Treponema sp.]|jgi:hypothetical protein|nr:hypothetical protein [Treponema sp.]
MALKTTETVTVTVSDAVLLDEDVVLRDIDTTGAVKGTVTHRGGGVYGIPIFNVHAAGRVEICLDKPGYTMTPPSRMVNINFVPPLP